MTNKEKFKEIFGIEPDCGRCNPYPCEEKDCKYWEQCEDQPGCACDDWWDWEFEEPTTKNDLGVDNQNIRLIDANALIKRLRPKHFDWWGEGEQDDFSKGNNSMLEEVIEAIEEFPSVTPQEPRWIPVSERLPEEYKRVLVFDSWGGVYVGQYVDAEENWGGEHFINEAGMHSKTVVAWMPLPKHYEPQES